LPVLAAFIVAAEEQGVPQAKAHRTIQNDILKEFMVRNTYIYPPAPSMRIVRRHHRITQQSGCRASTRSRSPAITCRRPERRRFRTGIHARRRARVLCAWHGGAVSTSTPSPPRLSFFFAIGMNFFMEIAKLRAARYLWAKLMRQFDAKNSASLALRTHCQTSGVSLTSRIPTTT
jgi:methylmalonyl-CoA mutase